MDIGNDLQTAYWSGYEDGRNEAEPKWISVDERLPEKDGKYIVARLEGSKHSISVRKFRKEVPCWYRGYCGHWEKRTNAITHWMPLPEPPKMKGESNG